MSDQKPQTPPPTLKSKLGLKLEVLGYGDTHPQLGPTLRVKRKNDGGIRDMLVSDLKRLNPPELVNSICDDLGEAPPAPQPQPRAEA